jgi:hypothetical protein
MDRHPVAMVISDYISNYLDTMLYLYIPKLLLLFSLALQPSPGYGLVVHEVS